MKPINRLILFLTLLYSACPGLRAQLTLEYCLDRARENYPAIKQYGIIEKTSALDLSDINKGWLPQATLYAQGTVQNDVPAFPAALDGVLEQLGQSARGLGKVQYKVGVDLSQTVWDGGASRSQRETARARIAAEQASADVEMYAVRNRVESLFFGILLIVEQMKSIRATIELLDGNLSRMRAMLANGTAMQSDVDMIEAQKLTVEQQLATAQGSALQYRRMLEVFIGEPVEGKTLTKPEAEVPADLTSARPELRLLDARKSLNDTQLSAIKSSLMPRVGLFAQAYYGYPGFDYFAAMRSRDLSFNVMAGVKVSWSISPFYSKRNRADRIVAENSRIEVDREKFLFDTSLSSRSQLTEIETLRKVMADDSRITGLRANVRKAAESQLRNGIIDTTALLTKITDENKARLTESYHEIEMLRLIYQLKNTLNR